MTTNSQDNTVNELKQFLSTLYAYDQAGGYVPLELADDDLAALNAYISKELAEVVGEDEWDSEEYNDTPNGSFAPFIERNHLRAEQRQRAKAKGYDV